MKKPTTKGRNMLCISLESKVVHTTEFNQAADFGFIELILSSEDDVSVVNERLAGMFVTLRAIYEMDVEPALIVCYNALLECLRQDRCPATVCIDDYRKTGNSL